MNNKNLIIDVISFNSITPDQINESIEQNNGKLIVSGVLQRANAINHNGRIYPKQILEREADVYNKNYIKERRALGELDHPDGQIVSLNNVSHNILELNWSNDDLIGKIEVLSTPAGNILKELFKSNIKLGISSRGFGSVKNLREGVVEVQDDFELIAFDFVSNPSTQGAFLKPVSITESKYNINNNNNNNIKNIYKNISSIISDILN